MKNLTEVKETALETILRDYREMLEDENEFAYHIDSEKALLFYNVNGYDYKLEITLETEEEEYTEHCVTLYIKEENEEQFLLEVSDFVEVNE